MITTRHLSAILLAVAVACGGSPPPYQERTLPSGQTVKVLGVGKMFFTKGDAALMVKYQTDLSLDDQGALHREVLAIWDVFRQDVEQAGLKGAIVSANERPVSPSLLVKQSLLQLRLQPRGGRHLRARPTPGPRTPRDGRRKVTRAGDGRAARRVREADGLRGVLLAEADEHEGVPPLPECA